MQSDTAALKRSVHRNFSRAAWQYDQAASLQQQVGSNLAGHLPEHWQPEILLDAGAGTGFFSAYLQKRYPKAAVLSLDIAEPMAQQAKRRFARVLNGDFDALPIAAASLSGIFSNLALQWSGDLNLTLREFNRVLQPQGWLLFSTLSVNTFIELKQAWATLDDQQHLQRFLSETALHTSLMDNNFSNPMLRREVITVYGKTLSELLHSLKAVGANAVPQQRTALLGKRTYAALQDAYEIYRTSAGLLPLTYEVIYGKAMVCQRD